MAGQATNWQALVVMSFKKESYQRMLLQAFKAKTP